MVAAQKLRIILVISGNHIFSSFEITEIHNIPLSKSGISSLLHSNGERVKLRHNLNTTPRVSQAGFMLISYHCIILEFLSTNTRCQLKIHTNQSPILYVNSRPPNPFLATKGGKVYLFF